MRLYRPEVGFFQSVWNLFSSAELSAEVIVRSVECSNIILANILKHFESDGQDHTLSIDFLVRSVVQMNTLLEGLVIALDYYNLRTLRTSILLSFTRNTRHQSAFVTLDQFITSGIIRILYFELLCDLHESSW